jgi:rubrerythrin
MKYLIFSDKAGNEGFTNIARLFTAIAFAERVHALNGNNLDSAISRSIRRTPWKSSHHGEGLANVKKTTLRNFVL